VDPEELFRMLREANVAVQRGADPEAVGERISQMTGGRLRSLAGLGQAVAAAQQDAPVDPQEAAQHRLASSGGSAVGDFARMAAQGATFGLADEIAGGVAGLFGGDREAVTEASRQRVADLRQTSPGASMMSEIAGGVAVPFMTGAKLARGLTRTGSGVLARSVAGATGGAVAGAAGSGLYAAGEAEGGAGERAAAGARGTVPGLIGGALLGGGAPLAGALLGRTGRFMGEVFSPEGQGQREARRRLRQVFGEAGVDPSDVPARMDALGPNAVIADIDPRLAREARNAANQSAALERTGGPVERLRQRTEARGERLAAQLRETSGISESMQSGQEAARRAVQEVREQHYHPLERAFPEVDGEAVQAALRDPRVARVARRTAPESMASEGAVRRVIEQGIPEDQARQMVPTKPPSFTELQDIMMDLRDEVTAARAAGRPNASRRAAEALDLVMGAMEQDIPGFREAQSAFRLASKKLEAYDQGFGAWTRSAREIQEEMASLPPEAHDSFRAGLLQRWEEKLLTKEGTTGAVNSILQAGEDMRGQIRAAFGSEDGFRQFLQQRDVERVFRRTEAALQGNSTTAQQALDAIDAAPTTKSELFNRIYDAILSPGESRRVQAEAVGERLLGSNVPDLLQTLQPHRMGFGVPGAGAGMGAAAGTAAGYATQGGQPPRQSAAAPDSLVSSIVGRRGQSPLAALISARGGGR
jgi:hypothetical protein